MCGTQSVTTMEGVKLLVRLVAVAFAVVAIFMALVAGAAVYSWNTRAIDTVGRVDFGTPLRFPPVDRGHVDSDGTRTFDLTMQSGTSDLGHGPGTRTWGINGTYLGPTLRATRGEQVRMHVTNALGETSSLHWHGMRLPAVMDGGPHQPVDPDTTWSPHWTVDQPAATLWYHPHLHGTTASHVYRGLAGMFLIDEPDGSPLPDEYGVDDIPVIVQDKKFDGDQLDDSSAMFSDVGTLGDEILVNGTARPFLDTTTEAVRLRLLNASNARTYDFSFDTGMPFLLVGSDGGLLETPAPVRNIRLSPGERAEIVVRPEAGSRHVLRSTPPDLGADFWQDRFSGGADRMDILEVRAAPTLTPSDPIPDRLTTFDDLGSPTETRRIDLTSSTTINGREMDMSRIDEVVVAGSTELWEIRNVSGTVHNFHIHDTQFEIVEMSGMRPGHPALAGRKDTVFMPPGATARLLVPFGRHTDPETPYMYHCHLLRHEDNGMMGQFVVVGAEEVHQVTDTPASIGHHHGR